MIISLDGPEKAGKTTLANAVLNGFEKDRSRLIKQSGRDRNGGLGYLHAFIAGLDSTSIQVWDRTWISEFIYGTLLGQDRPFAEDPFLGEWLYGRTMEGRGGKFIVLPFDPCQLEPLRDETDLDVSPEQEYWLFKQYATRWGYKILVNDYTDKSLVANTLAARRSPFVGVHKIPSIDYVGSMKPSITFVGDSRQEFSFEQRPFFGKVAAEYFRPFGTAAIRHFGYSSVNGFDKHYAERPHLFAKPIMVGAKAAHFFPEHPRAPYIPGDSSNENVLAFLESVVMIIEEYEK